MEKITSEGKNIDMKGKYNTYIQYILLHSRCWTRKVFMRELNVRNRYNYLYKLTKGFILETRLSDTLVLLRLN
jgi:hypothetical protein